MGGMNAFVKEAVTMIPQDEVMVLLFRKLEESNAFSSLLEKLNEEDFEKLCENFQVSARFKELLKYRIYLHYSHHCFTALGECSGDLF